MYKTLFITFPVIISIILNTCKWPGGGIDKQNDSSKVVKSNVDMTESIDTASLHDYDPNFEKKLSLTMLFEKNIPQNRVKETKTPTWPDGHNQRGV